MSRLDALPADQRAVLALLLKQEKSYDQLAELLRISPATVRDRAHLAVDALGPADGEAPDDDWRAQIADYLLGQQPVSERIATRAHLESSAPARAWARVVSGELRPLATRQLPEIPAEAAEVDEAFDALQARTEARDRAQRSSKLGGALLLAGLGVLLALVLVLVLRGGDDDDGGTATTRPAATSTTGQEAQVEAQINLVPPSGRGESLGVATILRQAGQRAIALRAQDLSPSPRRAAYAVWLYNSRSSARFLGFVRPVGEAGAQGEAALPEDATRFRSIVLTRERVARPRRPGQLVLSGRLAG
jgi:hypothetical protein